MARPAKEIDTNITFGEWTPEESVNPYTEQVADLAKRAETNANAAMHVTADVDDAKNVQNKIQRAANAIGKTARLRHTNTDGLSVVGNDGDEVVYGGNVILTFTISEKHRSRGKRGPAKKSAGEAPAE